MTLPTSRLAYKPYYEILDRALESEKGVQVRVRDWGEGLHLRIRLHTARSLDRDLSREAYEPDNPKHGTSVYDELIVKVENDGDDVVVKVVPNSLMEEIEEIA